MTEPEVRYESVFRQRWRDRQSAGARPGELIKQPRWIDVGLLALCVLFAVGAVVGATVTIEQTAALPAVANGAVVTAVRDDHPVPPPGDTVQFRDSAGDTRDAVIVAVTGSEVVAEVAPSGTVSSGELLLPAGRQRLIGMMLPRLG
ncbi:hypothetical protein JRC04_16930 [Mycolicibacterium sp. S2-37]|uniref:hypothetical protein n=1 Tax=Mycolicibacterium sp. S2-37 TaxID=2810297 RepID=UPI001A93CAE4|nr:hypothetical protein [Mycolicibacterium sp. S2-37]MBO0679151.1 hypothetical protein [Mycolicibacterium sp. S2-37]